MPFHHAARPAFLFDRAKLHDLIQTLLKKGYDEHQGRRVEKRGEIIALYKLYGNGRRQCHVQIVRQKDSSLLALYAHTEPSLTSAGNLVRHGLSALFDGADFRAGAQMVSRDLKSCSASRA